ncbi:hypothetical protein HZC00_00170 [Candidatus Kaiserbacteria bacterium]|nr:hypothetical protein [Candidatus Kaiserbacteria bacterium]
MAKYIGVIDAPAKFGGACGFVNNPTLEDGSRCDIDLGENKNGRPKGAFVHRTFLPEGTRMDGTKISFDMEASSKGGYQAIKETITVLKLGPEPSTAPAKPKAAPKEKFEGKKPDR